MRELHCYCTNTLTYKKLCKYIYRLNQCRNNNMEKKNMLLYIHWTPSIWMAYYPIQARYYQHNKGNTSSYHNEITYYGLKSTNKMFTLHCTTLLVSLGMSNLHLELSMPQYPNTLYLCASWRWTCKITDLFLVLRICKTMSNDKPFM